MTLTLPSQPGGVRLTEPPLRIEQSHDSHAYGLPNGHTVGSG